MRAFVTGGHGFVGRFLCAHLADHGDEVIAPHADEVDVTDGVAVRKALEQAEPHAVYHLAGVASVAESWRDPTGVFAVNAGGTVAVLDAARALPRPPRVLVVSSAEVYGKVPSEALPITEEQPYAPVTPYAAAKAAAELAAVQAHLGWELPVVRARPFNHIGPGQSPEFAVAAFARRIVEAVESGAPSLRVGNLSARRDLTDVRDVVRAYRLLVLHGAPGEAYNVCSGQDVAMEEVVRRLLQAAGAELDVEVDPALLRPVDLPVLRGDARKLHAATGWTPEVALDRTLADVVDATRGPR
ncbi:MAG TPA: GDP-mannose 4,6-dehydratase [Acidimicrobiales bacterium]|nr:GDP-mannose 4,6-dehydratase [Acidimicrobiales bacterium]